MRVAFITRSTLYQIHGGSAVQILETAKELRKLGVDVTVYLSHEKINYEAFDLLHFFDIIRPANILYHINKTDKPFAISPLLVDYSEYDKLHRKGVTGLVFRLFSTHVNEYLKTVARWILGKDSLPGKDYLWKGHRRSILEVLRKAAIILPNSASEYDQLKKLYKIEKPHRVVPNGIDKELFTARNRQAKDPKLIICAARIEGIKNQLNLVRAVNKTDFTLMLIGSAAPNQKKYLQACKEVAASNIIFVDNLPQEELVNYYAKAKVHVLPSWFETCGLSSLEAAVMGCNIVITAKGFTRDYFGEDAFYCEPGDVDSIHEALVKAAAAPGPKALQERIRSNYTWDLAAQHTLEAYKTILK